MERNVPKLRFKEFSDEWEKKHLSNMVERVVRKNKDNRTQRPLTISAQYGLVDQEEFFNKIVASKNLEGYYLLEKGEFAYNKSYSNGYPFGTIKRLDRYDNGAVSTLYICFNNKENYNSDYLVQYFESSKWHREVSMIAVEGARNHGLLNVSVPDFFDTIHRVPALQEQERIANFLTKVDKIIEKQDEKVKNLENYKKGMMQKIFSQEIRFKDENGEEYPEWEERRLGDFIIEYTEKTTENNQYEPLTSSRKGLFLQSEYFNKQIASEDNTGYNIVPKGYFTYRHMSDDSIFYFNINDIIDFGIVSTLYPVFTVNEGMNSRFLRYYLNEGYDFKKYCLLQKQGGSRTYMYLNKLKGFRGKFPVIMEQNKIAKFLLDIDSLVNKEKEKLEELKQWKKGLLQQIFV